MSLLDIHSLSSPANPATIGLSAMPPVQHRPHVRTMEVEDLAGIRTLLDKTIGVSLLPYETDALLSNAIRLNYGACTVAVSSDGEVVGCCFAVHDGLRAAFRHVAVDPQFAGIGLGKELLQPGFAHFKALGIERVLIQVAKENTAIEFWEKQGFVPERERVVGMRSDLNLG